MVDSADCWIIHNADKAPAFIMAKAGYDVWLGNQRGNKYSRQHKYLNPDVDEAYWKFSWTEMGDLDAPS